MQWVWLYITFFPVDMLAKAWRVSEDELHVRTFDLAPDMNQLQSFVTKYNLTQQQLKSLAAMDDLLSGKLCDPHSISEMPFCHEMNM